MLRRLLVLLLVPITVVAMDSNEPCQWSDLPMECHKFVLQHLDVEDVASMLLVSKEMKTLAIDCLKQRKFPVRVSFMWSTKASISGLAVMQIILENNDSITELLFDFEQSKRLVPFYESKEKHTATDAYNLRSQFARSKKKMSDKFILTLDPKKMPLAVNLFWISEYTTSNGVDIDYWRQNIINLIGTINFECLLKFVPEQDRFHVLKAIRFTDTKVMCNYDK